MTIEIAALLLGLISVFVSLYYGTRRRRLKKKITDYQRKLSKIEEYTKQTGYKSMIRDCFSTFSYVAGLCLITHGIQTLLSVVYKGTDWGYYFDFFATGIYAGAGVLLIEMCIQLARAENSEESIESMKNKIEVLQAELK